MTHSQEMVVKIALNPSIYTKDGALDALLAQIEKEVQTFDVDLSSEEGRKSVASNAYLIARSKTALDNLGKEMVSAWKQKAKKVDKQRKHVRETLDALKAKYRGPLTEWENAEKKRLADVEERINRLREMAKVKGSACSVEEIERYIREVNGMTIEPTYYGEHAEDAKEKKTIAEKNLDEALQEAKQIAKDKIELKRLRDAEAKRKQKEAEEKQKQREKEIAEKAAREAAEAERIRVEKEKEAEFKQKLAEAKAEQERIEKAIAEKEKAERDAADKERQRMMDVAHRQDVRNKVIHAFCGYGLTKTTAKVLFDAIDKGKIPHAGITY
jgi:septal ring factor EnvC (AmiA/AmiB activator)